nr:hypothetical protein Iba_chr12fCG10140 [Ipomoea batatas]
MAAVRHSRPNGDTGGHHCRSREKALLPKLHRVTLQPPLELIAVAAGCWGSSVVTVHTLTGEGDERETEKGKLSRSLGENGNKNIFGELEPPSPTARDLGGSWGGASRQRRAEHQLPFSSPRRAMAVASVLSPVDGGRWADEAETRWWWAMSTTYTGVLPSSNRVSGGDGDGALTWSLPST